MRSIVLDSVSAVAIGGGVGFLITAIASGQQVPFIVGFSMVFGAVTLKNLVKE